MVVTNSRTRHNCNHCKRLQNPPPHETITVRVHVYERGVSLSIGHGRLSFSNNLICLFPSSHLHCHGWTQPQAISQCSSFSSMKSLAESGMMKMKRGGGYRIAHEFPSPIISITNPPMTIIIIIMILHDDANRNLWRARYGRWWQAKRGENSDGDG